MESPAEKQIRFQELEDMDAPSWESFYKGALLSLGFILVGAAAAT
jgi:hypothetical protein